MRNQNILWAGLKSNLLFMILFSYKAYSRRLRFVHEKVDSNNGGLCAWRDYFFASWNAHLAYKSVSVAARNATRSWSAFFSGLLWLLMVQTRSVLFIMAFDDLLLVMVNLPYYVHGSSRHYYTQRAPPQICARCKSDRVNHEQKRLLRSISLLYSSGFCLIMGFAINHVLLWYQNYM